MKMRLTILLAASIGAAVAASAEAIAAEEPKLILAITIDGLRGDIPFRYAAQFGPGGFRYLMEQGVVYDNAHYQHSTTFTAVGHATLFTGGNSPQHGLAGNDWHDASRGGQVYCVEDHRHPIIGKEVKAHEGTSPRNLTASTYGDELIVASGGRSRAAAGEGRLDQVRDDQLQRVPTQGRGIRAHALLHHRHQRGGMEGPEVA